MIDIKSIADGARETLREIGPEIQIPQRLNVVATSRHMIERFYDDSLRTMQVGNTKPDIDMSHHFVRRYPSPQQLGSSAVQPEAVAEPILHETTANPSRPSGHTILDDEVLPLDDMQIARFAAEEETPVFNATPVAPVEPTQPMAFSEITAAVTARQEQLDAIRSSVNSAAISTEEAHGIIDQTANS